MFIFVAMKNPSKGSFEDGFNRILAF